MESVLIGLITILFIILSVNINTLRSEQKQIESKLNRIIDHLGVTNPYIENIDDELRDEIIRLVGENKKVRAIKKLKDVTGMDLKEAKDYVDSL